jgi:hypothetical protein
MMDNLTLNAVLLRSGPRSRATCDVLGFDVTEGPGASRDRHQSPPWPFPFPFVFVLVGLGALVLTLVATDGWVATLVGVGARVAAVVETGACVTSVVTAGPPVGVGLDGEMVTRGETDRELLVADGDGVEIGEEVAEPPGPLDKSWATAAMACSMLA